MCGICGTIELKGLERDAASVRIARMVQSIHHRGPDDNGTAIFSKAALGMARLAIIDPSLGKQPLSDSTGRYTIVFNGEIYNYKQLRRVLERVGHSFSTNSDTEVVLHAFIEFKEDCVEHLNGMFAFVIWDDFESTLFGARDRFGLKPLFISQNDRNCLEFGSEMRVFEANSERSARIDLRSLSQYLAYEYLPSPQTMIRNVSRLPAASYFTFSSLGLKIERYWQPSFARSESRPPTLLGDYLTELERRLRAAVEMEMVSDVPIGVLLSGGLDSSTVAYFATEAAKHNGAEMPPAFSVKFEADSFDESKWATMVAKHLSMPHHVLEVSEQMLIDGTLEVLKSIDEPFADPSFVPTMLLSQFTRQHVKVVLGGDGGDELFAGYPTYLAHQLIYYYETLIPRWIRASLIPSIVELLPVSDRYLSIDFKLKRFLSGRGLPIEVRHQRWLGSFSPAEISEILLPEVQFPEADIYDPARHAVVSSGARMDINQVLACDMALYLEGDILTKVDRASMLKSLEVRVPLLNQHLARFVLEMPPEFKIKGLQTKRALRSVMRGKLPDAVLTRRKQGFSFHLGRMLKTGLKPVMMELLSEDRLKRQAIFNPEVVKLLIDDHLSGRKDLRKQLWTLMMFQGWYSKYIN